MDRPRRDKAPDQDAPVEDGDVATGAEAWASYRRWLARDGAPPTRRASGERSVYSWKGYQSWADRVRQSWKPDS